MQAAARRRRSRPKQDVILLGTLNQLGGESLLAKHLVGGHHRNTIPRTDLRAQCAADAPRQIDGADLHDQLMLWTRQGVDTIDGTYRHAGLTTGAHVFIQQGKLFRQFLGHTTDSTKV